MDKIIDINVIWVEYGMELDFWSTIGRSAWTCFGVNLDTASAMWKCTVQVRCTHQIGPALALKISDFWFLLEQGIVNEQHSAFSRRCRGWPWGFEDLCALGQAVVRELSACRAAWQNHAIYIYIYVYLYWSKIINYIFITYHVYIYISGPQGPFTCWGLFEQPSVSRGSKIEHPCAGEKAQSCKATGMSPWLIAPSPNAIWVLIQIVEFHHSKNLGPLDTSRTLDDSTEIGMVLRILKVNSPSLVPCAFKLWIDVTFLVQRPHGTEQLFGNFLVLVLWSTVYWVLGPSAW